MLAANEISVMPNKVRIRPIAIPVEHGGWSLLFEPIVLGLLLAPSRGGFFLAVAAVGAFLARHPFRLMIGDWRRRRRTARTALAKRFFALYLLVAISGLALAINAARREFIFALLLAAPFVIVQILYDSFGRNRSLVAELAGAIATGALAMAITMGGGWSRLVAFGLWITLAARTVPTILYLRARLRLLHKRSASPSVSIAAHLAALVIVISLMVAGLAPFLAVIAVVVLVVRAMLGFVKADKQITAKKLGLRELAYGAMTVYLVAGGYIAGW